MKTLKSKIVAGISALVLLFGAFYIVEAMDRNDLEVKNNVTLVSVNWEFTPTTSNDPLNPENYTASSTAHCQGASQLCGIQAPSDENGLPIIEENSPLAQRIQNKDTSQGDVFLMN
ncbi:hypothetical protein [Sphingobacterium sp. UBA6320]|uniref:hypothetical protein n=1 Tax=Sphingobacterium sp. UBA6320 TaxID=1947510 RepID=UPI0025F257D5|nr:hypothetical protein [Sphingobacterium sp. UBA6320]